MNFVDAALALLEEATGPMHVEELCRLAVERELLSRPGNTPLRSMKGRLSTELKKGDASRVVKVEGDLWALSDAGQESPPKAEPAKAKAKASVAAAEPVSEPLDDESQALVNLYADETAETTPVAQLSEYRDEQTADEDRLMLPEIKAQRRGRSRPSQPPERRKRRRRGSRAEREQDSSRTRSKPQAPSEPDVEVEQGEAAEPTHSALVNAAIEVLGTVQRGQALPVRQLTQMMSKRQLVDGNADNLWRLVKGVLLHEQSKATARGMAPPVIYRGRDLFALPSLPSERRIEVAERDLLRATAALEAVHREVLGERLAHLSTKLLERIAQVHLHVTGWTDINWIKRVDKSAYATAVSPNDGPECLVSVRVGPEAVERRGVGELRAGLVAKEIERGLLLSPCDLSPDAHSELAKDGPPIDCVCGEALVEALRHSGVATRNRVVTITETDWSFVDSVLA